MKIPFPSRQFDDAVAAVCHGSASDEQMQALNELLRSDAVARDEYILRLELHSRLASEPHLFAATPESITSPGNVPRIPSRRKLRTQQTKWVLALAACIALVATGWLALRWSRPNDRTGATSKAVAMLNRVLDAQWNEIGRAHV